MLVHTESWQFNTTDQTLIDLALTEDLGQPYQDITTATLFSDVKNSSQAKIISKHPEPIIIAGLPLIKIILEKLTQEYSIQTNYQDGQTLSPGDTLVTLTANANVLLMAERTILNFLQRLCAVATLTAKFVAAVNGTQLKILDTRKTMPGFRHLEKYAVLCGGGVNHRIGLYDALLIKDTHIDLLGGVAATLNKLTAKFSVPVIIEIRTLDELKIVLAQGREKINRVLLDNMTPQLMAECVTLCRGIFPTEASGNIDLTTIVDVAKSGVDFASVGKLTHSANSVDLSMKCDIKHAK